MAKKRKSPPKMKSVSARSPWELPPEVVRRAFAVFGETELRRMDDDDIFMGVLDPGGKLREMCGAEIIDQREVIQAIVGLQKYGTVVEIKEIQGLLQLAALALRWLHRQPSARWDPDAPGETGNKVLEEVLRLNTVLVMAESHELTLRDHGLRFDPDAKMAISTERGRPSPFINRIIGMQAIALRDTHPKPEDLQTEIHRRLSRFFLLSDDASGPRGTARRTTGDPEGDRGA